MVKELVVDFYIPIVYSGCCAARKFVNNFYKTKVVLIFVLKKGMLIKSICFCVP